MATVMRHIVFNFHIIELRLASVRKRKLWGLVELVDVCPLSCKVDGLELPDSISLLEHCHVVSEHLEVYNPNLAVWLH